MTTPLSPARTAATRGDADLRVTQWRVMRSEWTKLRSLRSTVMSLLVAVVLVVGFAGLIPAVTVAHWPPPRPQELLLFDPTSLSLVGIFLAQMAVGVLGVLLITGEYATGMIRATLAAVPTRLPMLSAKAAVFAAVTFTLMLPTVFGAFLLGQAIFASKHLETTLGAPGVTRAVVGAALYLTVVGLLGLGLGALLRNTAAAVSALFGVLFVLPIIVRFLPSSFSDPVGRYLPGSAGTAVIAVRQDPASLTPWAGFGVFCLYAAVLLGAAAWRLRSRDV